MYKLFFYVIAISMFVSSFSDYKKLDFNDIVFIILSQKNLRHEEKALKLKQEIREYTNFSSFVYLTHLDFNNIGDWTVMPILPIFWQIHQQEFSWVFFCTDDTKVDPVRLKEVLETLPSEAKFVGRGLYDKEPTIIHHFSSVGDFKYPLFSSGFTMHRSLIQKLIKRILMEQNNYPDNIFSIDASYELASFIKINANGTKLIHSPFFCINYKKNCASYIRNNYICDKPPVDIKKIFFAVKTCHKFHKDRVPVVQKTWGQWAHHLKFFSDVYDTNIPTVQIDVPNTSHGHCAKTKSIIKNLSLNMEMNENLEWAVISDDDTIFSTYRLQELLGCYNFSDAVVIGERYGYNLMSEYSYNYITGGGGIVLSRATLQKFSKGDCKCHSIHTPDDMMLLGICLQQLNITIVHIPFFHQARPVDYSEEYLLIGPPISFHKHWMIDPIQVYKDWFQLSDVLYYQKNAHIEL